MFGENVCHNKRKKHSDQKSKNQEVIVEFLKETFRTLKRISG